MIQAYPQQKKSIATTLKKASSHLETICEMVQNNDYCIDILQQMKAVHGLLHAAMDQTLELHLMSCFKKGMESASEKRKQELLNEIIQVTKMANK